MDQIKTYWANLQESFPVLLTLSVNVVAAFAILILGWIVARWARKRIRRSKFVAHHHVDSTIRPVIASLIFYIIMAMALYGFLIKLGVPAASLLAIFGAAGLAIGLALKDTLSNIAAGVMLLALRPLAVGEFIDSAAATGTIEEIGLFATTIKNAEGVYIYVPNREMWRSRIQNFARHQNRKAIIEIGVGYETDLETARARLLELLANTPDVKDHPTPPEVYVMGFGESAINLSCRCWLPGDNWLARTSNLRIAIKQLLDGDGIEIPFPQRVVRNVKD